MNVNGFMDLPSWANGLVVLPWWGYILVALLATHITIAAVTIYLHRYSAHRALELHPAVALAEVESARTRTPGLLPPRRRPAMFPVRAKLIVFAALLRIAEHLVGLVDLLEFLLGGLLVLRRVGMKLPGELAEGALDFVLARGLRDPERLVIIAILNGHAAKISRVSKPQITRIARIRGNRRARKIRRENFRKICVLRSFRAVFIRAIRVIRG